MQFADTSKKTNDVIENITDTLESSCKCDLSAKHVARDRLMCGDSSTDRVIFVGALIGTETTKSVNIRQQLQELVNTEPTILVQGVHLKIAACVVKLEENEKPQCIPPSTPSPQPSTDGVSGRSESQSSGFAIYIGIAGGAFLVLICITSTLIVAIVIMKRRQKKRTASVDR